MRKRVLWCVDHVRTETGEGSAADPYVFIRPVDERLYHGSEYRSGGRTISPEDAAVLAEFLKVKNLERPVPKYFGMPVSVTSFEDVLNLLVQRAKTRKQIPSWVPSLLVSALPGSEDWDADRDASEQILTARIARIASGDLVHRQSWQDPDYRMSVVPLRYRHSGFEGRLIIRRETADHDPDEYVWIGIERLALSNESEAGDRSVDPSRPDQLASYLSTKVDEDSYQLPIADPDRFSRLMWELTKPMPGH